MIDLLYIAIREKLVSDISALKEVMYYLGQPEADAEGVPLFAAPAVFIRFGSIQFLSNMGPQFLANLQQANVLFTITLVDDTVYDDDKRILDATLNHLGKINAIFAALQRYAPLLSDLPGNSALAGTSQNWAVSGSFERISMQTDHSVRGTIATSQTFKCVANDLSQIPNYQASLQNIVSSINLQSSIVTNI